MNGIMNAKRMKLNQNYTKIVVVNGNINVNLLNYKIREEEDK